MHCRRFQPAPLSRRDMLARCANGFGAVALSALLADESFASARNDPLAPRPTHYPVRAKNVIFLFMDGGPSQMDTFDPKPRLDKEHGQPIKVKVEPTQFKNVGTLRLPYVQRSLVQSMHGESCGIA